MRGTRPAGYGFVSVKDKKVADDAIAALNNKELKGRPVVVEHAKDEETKKKEASERKARRTSRRGSRAPRGEVTEEEANGEAAAPAEGQADAPKRTKKKRNAAVRNPTSHFSPAGVLSIIGYCRRRSRTRSLRRSALKARPPRPRARAARS